MDLVHNNPFRVLGLPINASEKQITKRISDLAAYLEIGKAVKYETDFSFISPVIRTEESVREAANRIESLNDRFFYSLFWFWNFNSCDDIALDVLSSGNIEKAITLLESQFKEKGKSNKLYSSAKNLSVLYFFLASKSNVYDFGKLAKGLHWAGLVLNTKLLTNYAKRIVDDGFIYDQDQVLVKYVHELTKTVDQYIDKPDGVSSKNYISYFNRFPEKIYHNLATKFTTKTINNINNAIEASEKDRERSPEKSDRVGFTLKNTTLKDLEIVRQIYTQDDCKYQFLADNLADEILQCGIDYYNHYINSETGIDPGDQALMLAKIADSIAVGHKVKARLSESILVIQKWVDGKANRDKQKRVASYFDYIYKQINNLPDTDRQLSGSRIDSLPELAEQLINNCKPKLYDIGFSLGKNDEEFLDISSTVVNYAIEMCIIYVNERREFEKILNIFSRLGTLEMNNQTRKRYSENLLLFKKSHYSKGHIDFILGIIKRLPNFDSLSVDEIVGLPAAIRAFISSCQVRLGTVKQEDNALYFQLSSAVANNALGMCIEYANKTHDSNGILATMKAVGELSMEPDLRQRYDQNFQIMLSNLAARQNSSRPQNSPVSSSGGGCYIATMVYGHYDAPEVLVLRQFRDGFLEKMLLGRWFIALYYWISPKVVRHCGHCQSVRWIVRFLLDGLTRRLR